MASVEGALKQAGEIVVPFTLLTFAGQKLGLIGVGPRTPKWFRPAADQRFTATGPEFVPAPDAKAS